MHLRSSLTTESIRSYVCDCPLGFPGGSSDNESACDVGHLGSIPGLGRSPREEKGYPLQYSGLENSKDYKSLGSQRVGHN